MSRNHFSSYTLIQRIWFILLVFFLPLAVLFVSGELLARLLARPCTFPTPGAPRRIDPYQANPYVVRFRPNIYSHIPGARYTQTRAGYAVDYSINSLGFRGPEVLGEGRQRLLIIGDSIVEGQGSEFDATFTYLIGEWLGQEGWEVINAGVQGASPIYYAANLDRYLALGPTAVLMVLYENDLHEDRKRERDYFDLSLFDDINSRLQVESGGGLLRRSRLRTVLRRFWRRYTKSELEHLIRRNRDRPGPHREGLSIFRKKRVPLPLGFVDDQWQMSRPYLDFTLDEFQQREVTVGVVYISLNGFKRTSRYYNPLSRFDRLIGDWAGERGVEYLSLLAPLDQRYGGVEQNLYLIEGDAHPTPEAHRELAEFLTPFVLQTFDR